MLLNYSLWCGIQPLNGPLGGVWCRTRPWPLLVQYDHTVSCSCNVRTRRLLPLCSFRVSVIETRCIPNTRGIRAAFAVEVPIGGEVCQMTRSALVLVSWHRSPARHISCTPYESSWLVCVNLLALLAKHAVNIHLFQIHEFGKRYNSSFIATLDSAAIGFDVLKVDRLGS
jgi:hypothetical protein